MQILDRAAIEARIDERAVLAAVERAFAAYSRGEAQVPPPGELIFAEPPGDVHIKYGAAAGFDHYVVKVASGFYDNPKRGLPSSNGLMLLFERETGRPAVLLKDDGLLTDLRTAAAGAVAAKYLAPESVETVGIVGAGIQARLQLRWLAHVRSFRRVVVWARDPARTGAFVRELAQEGFAVTAAKSPAELGAQSQIIVTTTPAQAPLLSAGQIGPGTHITAMGADTPHKQELDPAILAKADRLVVDSLKQTAGLGEMRAALAAGLAPDKAVELGALVADPPRRRPGEISVAVLTGLAVQDLAIAALCI